MKIVKCVLLLFSLEMIHAKISIDVTASNTSDILINYSGLDVNVITNEDINLFRINNKNVYDALKNYFGRKPNNVYLKSPTPWGDLYKKYKWEEVSRILTVKSAVLKNADKKPVIVMSQDFFNYSNKTVKVNTGISQTVENSITTSWSHTQELTITQEIEYDVNVIFAKVSGTTGISYTSTWGKNVEKSESVTIGTTTSMETELAPGQAATAVLSANRGSMELEIVYAASLRGNVAVNFKKPLNGHHFLGPRVEKVMDAGGLSNELTTVEIIRVGIYTDASLKVYDKASGFPL